MMLAKIKADHLIFSACTHADGLVDDKTDDQSDDERINGSHCTTLGLDHELASVPIEHA